MSDCFPANETPDWLDPTQTVLLLYKSVPLLQFVGFQLQEVSSEQVVGLLPLKVESTNHNGSHFGMAISMAADTVGALLMARAIGPARVIGLHPQHDDNGAAVWLARATIDYLRPSVDDLVVTASISTEVSQLIRKRYAAGRRVVAEVAIVCEAQGEIVARGSFTYITQPARTLKPRSARAQTSILFKHKITASARLVAAVRAMEAAHQHPLFVDPWAASVAGAHGRFLAGRMTQILPALPAMIASRTRYFDDVIVKAVDDGVEQVLILGTGFDTRMYRLPIDRTSVTVYEVDLPDMIAARETLLAALPNLPLIRRETVGINLEIEDLVTGILSSTTFSPTRPTVVVFEGVAMYLAATVNQQVITSLQSLLSHPKSRLALDIVANEVVTGETTFSEARNFLEGMRELGEPFLFGISDPDAFFHRHGYRIVARAPSNHFRAEDPAGLFKLYNFFVIQPNTS